MHKNLQPSKIVRRGKTIPLGSFKFEGLELNQQNYSTAKKKLDIPLEFLCSPDTLLNLAANVVDKLPVADVYKWSEDDCIHWIHILGYPQYRESFRINSINGRKLLLVNATALQKMNIKDFEHIRNISQQIRRLFGFECAKFVRNLSLPTENYLEVYNLLLTRVNENIDKRKMLRRSDLWRKLHLLRQVPKPQTHWDKLERWLRCEPEFYEREIVGGLQNWKSPLTQLPLLSSHYKECICRPVSLDSNVEKQLLRTLKCAGNFQGKNQPNFLIVFGYKS